MNNPQAVIEILKLIWPLIVLEYALAIWAVVDIVRVGKTRNLSVVGWILIVIFIQLIGPLAYFLFGRFED